MVGVREWALIGFLAWGLSGPVALGVAAWLTIRDERRQRRHEAALDALVADEAPAVIEAAERLIERPDK